MSGDDGFDIAAVGKVAKAIPAKAWNTLVETACETFKKSIAPFTATTSGIGRLIDARFDRLVEAEKILAADVVVRASRKAGASKRTVAQPPSAGIVIGTIEAAGSESDPVLRELWANLLAQELTQGGVHPELLGLLRRLSANDARVLSEVAEKEGGAQLLASVNRILASFSVAGLSVSMLTQQEGSFTHEHLGRLNLIRHTNGAWVLTHTGRAFIKAVTDPAVQSAA
jgi:hypothetical protein